MAAADDEVLYPWLRYVPGPKKRLLDLSLTATHFSKGKITTAHSFPTGNDYAFVATEGAPWQAAQAPQVMATTGGATETLAFHRGGEKGGKCTICEPDTNSSG